MAISQVQPWAFPLLGQELLGQRHTRDLRFLQPCDDFGAELMLCSTRGLQTRACAHLSPV